MSHFFPKKNSNGIRSGVCGVESTQGEEIVGCQQAFALNAEMKFLLLSWATSFNYSAVPLSRGCFIPGCLVNVYYDV